MLKVGDKAPDFSLLNQDEKEIKLSDFLGQKVVLYFYPKDNTSGCTNQACGFRDINEDLKNMNVKILGISRDKPKSHRNFIEKYGLNFDLLADPDKLVHDLYGIMKEKKMYGKTVMGVSRDTYIIDEEGKILEILRGVKAKDNPQDVLDLVKEME